MIAGRLVLATLGIVIAPGFAQAVQAPAPQEKEAKICRESARQTGSHIRTGRKCRTAEEWRKEDEAKARIPPSLTVTEGQNDGHPAQSPR